MFSNIDKNNYISKTLENKFKGNVDAFADKAFKESVFANQTNYDKFMKKPNP